MTELKFPQWKTLPQDYLHHLCGQSLSGMIPLMAILQQYSPPHRLNLAWRGRLKRWPFANREKTLSTRKSLRISRRSPQIPSLRTGEGSQTQTQQFTGGNASAAGDQMWGTSRAWHGTHFPNSLQKPLPAHADLHAETQQMHPDQQHPEFLPEL